MKKTALELYEAQLMRKRMNELLKEKEYVKQNNLNPSKIVEETIKTIDETKDINVEEERIDTISNKVLEFLKPTPIKVEETKSFEPLKDEDWIITNPDIKEKRSSIPPYAIEVMEKIVLDQSLEDIMHSNNLRPAMLENIVNLIERKFGTHVSEGLIPLGIKREIKQKMAHQEIKTDTKLEMEKEPASISKKIIAKNSLMN